MRQPTALGAYIFAGGFTAGAKQAGFNVLAHFEQWPYGTPSAKANWPELPIRIGPETWDPKTFEGKVDFLYSNPPCAAWSSAGASKATKWESDDRVDCTRRSFALMEQIRPQVWCWESVTRAYTLGRPLVDQLTKRALALGYGVTHLFIEASQLGLPQRRNRFFMVAHKVALTFEEPKFKVVTAGEALRKVKKPGPGVELDPDHPWTQLMKRCPPGKKLMTIFNDDNPAFVEKCLQAGVKVSGRPGFQRQRIDPTVPAPTLTGGATLVHPTEDRYITVAESAALCGYPSGFKFVGSMVEQYKQVAQAVTPPVGAWLAGIVKAGLTQKKPAAKAVRLVDLRPRPIIISDLGSGASYGGPEAPKTPAPTTQKPGPRPQEPIPRLASGQVIRPLPEHQGQTGRYIRWLLRTTQLGTPEILAQVKANFPTAKTGPADIAWNRGQIRKGRV